MPVAYLFQEPPPASIITTLAQGGSARGAVPPPAKKQKVSLSDIAPSSTTREVQRMYVDGLAEDEHVVLLALRRLQGRESAQTLSAILWEIQCFYQEAKQLLRPFSEDCFVDAFERMLDICLIEISPPSASDLPRRYMPCKSKVDRLYQDLIEELGDNSTAGSRRAQAEGPNPLRRLPENVQRFAKGLKC